MAFWIDKHNNMYSGRVNLTVTSSYQPAPNQALIDELDTKYLRVKRILQGLFIKRFYNQRALERLERFYNSLWWREMRKNRILELSEIE